MEIFKSDRFRITKGMLKNDNFTATMESGIIRINTKMGLNYNPYFVCIVMNSESDKQEMFTINEFVYNKYTHKFILLDDKKIGNHLVYSDVVKPDYVLSLFSFDEDTILIVVDDKEKQEDYDITR